VAASVRDGAVSALVRLAIAAGAGRLPVALSGGLLAPDRPLRDRVMAALEDKHGAAVIRRAIDPCRGAPFLAREATTSG
jgi:hypothetical protein